MKNVQFLDANARHVRLEYDRWGTGQWKVLIDNFNHALLFKQGDKWKGHLYGKSDLTSDDFDALGERIDEATHDIASN